MSTSSLKNRNLKVLIIGTGSIGERHIKNLVSIGVHDLIIFSRTKKTKGRYINFKNFEITNNFDELINKNITHCIICTPSAFHHNEILIVSNICKNILVEVPLVCNVKEFNSIAKIKA